MNKNYNDIKNKYLKYKNKYLLLKGGLDHSYNDELYKFQENNIDIDTNNYKNLMWIILGFKNNFHKDIECKIIKTFNKDKNIDWDLSFINYKNKEFLLRLLSIKDYKFFYIHKDLNINSNNNIIFYNDYRLKIFIKALNMFNLNYTIEDIFSLLCIKNKIRSITEIIIIEMLNGNIFPCNDLYPITENSLDINDSSFDNEDELINYTKEEIINLRNLKSAYLYFLETVKVKKNMRPISYYKKINSLDINNYSLNIKDQLHNYTEEEIINLRNLKSIYIYILEIVKEKKNMRYKK